MIKAGIVGGTGYTGVELLRLLAQHPEVELTAITSRGEAGTAVADMFPSLRGSVGLQFQRSQGCAARTTATWCSSPRPTASPCSRPRACSTPASGSSTSRRIFASRTWRCGSSGTA